MNAMDKQSRPLSTPRKGSYYLYLLFASSKSLSLSLLSPRKTYVPRNHFEQHTSRILVSNGQDSNQLRMIYLPSEILLLIFDQLHHNPDDGRLEYPYDLAFLNVRPLLGVCRRWYNLFLPKAYYSLDLICPGRQLSLLAWSLRENPSLGSLVHSFCLSAIIHEPPSTYDESDDDGFADANDEEILDDPQTTPLGDILRKASPDRGERYKWQQALIEDSEDAWIAIYLFLFAGTAKFQAMSCQTSPQMDYYCSFAHCN